MTPERSETAFLSKAGSGQRRHGYTLMELVVVMVILAVLLMAVTPIFRGSLSGARTEHAVRDLVMVMKSAQALAVSEAVEYRLYLDTDQNRYWLMRLDRIEGGDKVFSRPSDARGDYHYLPHDLTLERPKAERDRELDAYYVAFYPGGSRDAATIELSVWGDFREQYTIETGNALNRIDLEVP